MALLLLLAMPAYAHDDADHPGIIAIAVSGSGTGPSGLLLGAIAAVIGLGMTRRRLLALALAGLLLVLTLEAAVHSVHHLDDPARAAECAVAVATAHAPIDLADAVTADPAYLRVWYPIRTAFPDPLAQRAPAPRTGRSPPPRLV
ncbi:MAG TPA: hypothetical protein VGF31_14735 [Myxococcaceae bacterium]